MTNEKERRREVVEQALFSLGNAQLLMETQVRLRVEQAIQRDHSLFDLLEPVLSYLERVDRALKLAKDVLGDEWHRRQNNGW